ncbi:YbaB/EbfC family nucleoid-associated protein [Streptosporangium sp. NBC_01756]|uniref:YbaB/EbfC family nucleoid-associated protein n=1 Tax=Streptosporangium sp. NBC_01756 TaxID=2975950 RepID=UPI002DD8553C|nr:YbaB/EbfC family nucleoid-associated protein [Streptosporangium sp. NBC_01756]WSC84229.1 YbaB/EbfC family nucleoid-associated protein [Streptosporangium sp. NBC_01756]
MPAAPENDEPTGTGEAAGGMVGAVVGEDGLLATLRLDARAMRFGSMDLADHIVSAVRAAQQDRLERMDEATSAEEGVLPEEFMRRLDDMEAQASHDFARLTSSLDETLRRLEER